MPAVNMESSAVKPNVGGSAAEAVSVEGPADQTQHLQQRTLRL